MVKVGSLRNSKPIFSKFKRNRFSRKLRDMIGGVKRFYRKNDKAINAVLGTAATFAAGGIAYNAMSKKPDSFMSKHINRNNNSDIVHSNKESREIKRKYNDREAQMKAYEQLKFEEQNRQTEIQMKKPHRIRYIQKRVYPSATSSHSSDGPVGSSSSKINMWQYS